MYVKGICNHTIPTIAVEFCTKEIELKDGTLIKVQLWDTAGQERFKSLAMNYYRKASGILLLFDVTKKTSFEACEKYLEDIRRNSDKECEIYLVGNKIDLEDQREIQKYEAENYANRENIKYIETSAIKNLNVNEAFEMLLNDIYEKKSKIFEQEISEEKKNNNINLTTNPQNTKNGECCI
jgi:small GTP-binding protein